MPTTETLACGGDHAWIDNLAGQTAYACAETTDAVLWTLVRDFFMYLGFLVVLYVLKGGFMILRARKQILSAIFMIFT